MALSIRALSGTPVSLTLSSLVVASLASMPVMASENGQIHYPVGVNTIMNAALPAPGETGFYLYNQYYESTRLNDRNGKSIDPDFKAEVYAVVPRLIHTWNEPIGPFSISSGIILPMTRVDLKAFGRKDTSTGFGDPVLSPIYFNYVNSTGTFFAYGGPEIYVPIGKYDKDRLANNGLNYWTIAPSVSATWLPTPRWELSATLYPEFNFKNKDTDYHSGNSVTFDFDVAYRPLTALPKLKVAVQGFAMKQYTDDRQFGEDVPGGNRGRAFGLGPQVSYDIAGVGAVLVKYQKEFGVENRTSGNRFWLELALPL
ncbi:SphA family protein [Pseudomonas thivervalensis]|uniref:SphA family protein n=1 Tax=Pseudomonas thivervalensis TaxID=86265 RepID=UPI00069CCDDF|nr:transporter [Pseudomonas thivervalensis]